MMATKRSCFYMFLVTYLNVSQLFSIPSGKKVFMIVGDGIVYDFENYALMPNLERIAKHGMRAERMIPIFPTKTWPTITTLMTGLYAESHGILGNEFHEISTGDLFSFKDDPTNFTANGRFFTEEPIWMTNQKQGGSSCVYHLPGNFADPKNLPNYRNKPTIWSIKDAQNWTIYKDSIVESIEYMTKDDNLNLVILYVPIPDSMAHSYAKNSSQYKGSLAKFDEEIIGFALEKLKEFPDVNFIVTSDHGFMDVNGNSTKTKARFLDDYLQDGSFVSNFQGCTTDLRPVNGYTIDQLLSNLSGLNDTGHYRIFRKENLPTRLHYRHNQNIPPIVILADQGWILNKKRKPDTWIHGSHGYDNAYKDMSTVFFASGPSFKKNTILKPFSSVNVASLLSHLLGIETKPNNGSLHVFEPALNTPIDIDSHGGRIQLPWTLTTIMFVVTCCFVVLTEFQKVYF